MEGKWSSIDKIQINKNMWIIKYMWTRDENVPFCGCS